MNIQQKKTHTETVYALGLVGTNHNVGEGRALLEQENSIGIATLSLLGTRARAAVVADVRCRGSESLTSGNGNRLAEGAR